MLSNIVYTSLDDFLSEISEVSYEQAGKLFRNLDIVFNDLRCDIIIMGGCAFRRPREEGQGRSARYFSTALPELERINNKILGLWKL